MSSSTSYPRATEGRAADLHLALSSINARLARAVQSSVHPTLRPVLVAVSKYKPAEDIGALYDAGQRDFGENYAAELVEKARVLPPDIRWHFIGHLQSNKAKLISAIPNFTTLHTLSSSKLATTLNRLIDPSTRSPPGPLHVLIQVNTSGEDSKSGLPPLTLDDDDDDDDDASPSPPPTRTSPPNTETVADLARHVISSCPNLCLTGLMTIGSPSASLSSSTLSPSPSATNNPDFSTLNRTRSILTHILAREFPDGPWGKPSEVDDDGGTSALALTLSMGMSSDFEAAVSAGSGIVRVGSSIFGERHVKGDPPSAA